MVKRVLMSTALICLVGTVEARAQGGDGQIAAAHDWIYNDLPIGIAHARKTGKPLMVVIRCPP